MHIQTPEQSEAVRRYCAAFPALSQKEAPLRYMPPPEWGPRPQPPCAMPSAEPKRRPARERRNTYHGQRRTHRRRHRTYSRSFDGKESLPEWLTDEDTWDMDMRHDPVREYIRGVTLDEGYGTCENTVTEDVRHAPAVPDLDDGPDLAGDWALGADLRPRPLPHDHRFEAKFDRSLEALWQAPADTPDDDYQELPIDIHDLLSSPSDNLFDRPNAERRVALPLGDTVWSASLDRLRDRLQPLNISEQPTSLPAPPPPPFIPEPEPEPHQLYSCADAYEPLMPALVRSLAVLNHSREHSGFWEVLPGSSRIVPVAAAVPPRVVDEEPRDDPLTSARTHFRPIRVESDDSDTEAPRHPDGASFDIDGSPEQLRWRRSVGGRLYVGGDTQPHLTWRKGGLVFAVRQCDTETQTEAAAAAWAAADPGGGTARPMQDVLLSEWEELLADISAAHAQYAAEAAAGTGVAAGAEGAADRKRRHSAARDAASPPPGPRACTHPHAPFLHCTGTHRPLTR